MDGLLEFFQSPHSPGAAIELGHNAGEWLKIIRSRGGMSQMRNSGIQVGKFERVIATGQFIMEEKQHLELMLVLKLLHLGM